MSIRLRLTLLSLVLVLSAAIYLPGVSGPYLFDDYTNFLHNDFVRIRALDADSLYHAAYSVEAGPLKRPIAMLSFALNYYFAGGFGDRTPFKLTNLVIHICNGLLFFWLLRVIFTRLEQITVPDTSHTASLTTNTTFLAFAGALLWLVHPIQVTSVLYVVQRMTSLSATFVLLGIISYLKGRLWLLSGRLSGYMLMLAGMPVCGWLGMLSKENAILLLIFILTLEFTLFSDEAPWRSWRKLPVSLKRALVVAGIAVSGIALAWTINRVLPGYQHRPFTLMERVLTEARVLFFYIGLITLPRIDQFSLHHDDIALSSSLFVPWTTLPAVSGLVALIVIAFRYRKSQPLVSLGILWFFSGHLIESTIVPLEIAHEHRNYLASAGVLLVIMHLVDRGCAMLRQRWLWGVIPLLIVFFAGTTYLRAVQWSNERSLFAHEVLHHSDSAIAQYQFGIVLAEMGRYDEAEQAIKRAAKLEPIEASHYLWQLVITARQGKDLDHSVLEKILELLATKPLTASTTVVFEYVAKCIQNTCAKLQVPLEAWMRTILNRKEGHIDKSFYSYFLGISLSSQGRVAEAIEAFHTSYKFDSRYLHPLFSLASIHIQLGQLADAEHVLSMLREANKGNLHPRDREIEVVAKNIEEMRKGTTSTRPPNTSDMEQKNRQSARKIGPLP